MFYFVTIDRAGQEYYVVSPAYGKFELSKFRTHLFLWETEAAAIADGRWQHLIQDDDEVKYNRRYR